MSDESPPPDAEGAVRPAPQGLTPEAVEAVLGDFRDWLQHLPVPADAPPDGADADPVDLHTLLAQFTALRQEVNLQTRAARAQQEQNAATLEQLAGVLRALQESRDGLKQARADRATDDEAERLRPLLKTLVDVHDALALARRETHRARDVLLPELDRLGEVPASPGDAKTDTPLPFWAWLAGGADAVERAVADARRRDEEARREQADRTAGNAARVRQVLESLLTGYAMSLQRVERALGQHGLEPIAAAGGPFDPETMEALEVVSEPGRAATEVIDEVRRGYYWRGRLFRYAQVRVAKPAPTENTLGDV